MIFADFSKPVKTSELEKALSSALSDLGYKVKKVKDNYSSKEYIENKFVPIKEGVEYEIRRSFLEPKIYVGFKFELNFKEDAGKLVYQKEHAKQLYGWVYSINRSRYESTLLEIIKTTINKMNRNNETETKANITSYE